MPIATVLSFTEQLLLAIQHMHRKGYIHRDIKSGNILIGEPGSLIVNGVKRKYEQVLKVADFGLSRTLVVPPKPMTKEISTLYWRAPEVMLGNMRYTQAVDMWSIGIVIHEMLKGSLPFEGTTELEVLINIFRKKGLPSDKDAVFFRRSPVLKLLAAPLPKLTT